MQGQSVMPNLVTYNPFSGCQKGKQPTQTVEMFLSMQGQSGVPNILTYNAVSVHAGSAA